MTDTLADLMKRDDVRASWFYTHSTDSGRGNTYDHDVYDVVFSIDDGISLYGGRMPRCSSRYGADRKECP